MSLSHRGAATERSELRRFGTIVLTPDLFAQGLLPRFHEWVERWEADVVAAIPRLLSPADVAYLYAGRTTHANSTGRERNRWLTARLFELGPVLCLLLRARRRDAADLQSVIRDAKGKSGHGEHSPDSLRGMSPISDRGFSLVHSPDDADGFLHECRLFCGASGLRRALDPDRSALDRNEIAVLVPGEQLFCDAHPLGLIARIVERALSALHCDPRTPLDPRAVRPFLGDVRAIRQGLGAGTSFERGWRTLAEFADTLRDLAGSLKDWMIGASDPAEAGLAAARWELVRLLTAACQPSLVSSNLAFSTIEAFQRNHLPLTAWDQHRLQILAAFHGGRPEGGSEIAGKGEPA